MIIDRNVALGLQLEIQNAGIRDTVRSLERTEYCPLTDEPVVRIGWTDLAQRHKLALRWAESVSFIWAVPVEGLPGPDGWERADEYKRLFGRALV